MQHAKLCYCGSRSGGWAMTLIFALMLTVTLTLTLFMTLTL